MLLPSELSPPTSRDWITAGGGHGGRQSRVPPALDGETAGVLGPQHPEGGDLGPSRRPGARGDGGRGGGGAGTVPFVWGGRRGGHRPPTQRPGGRGGPKKQSARTPPA